MLVQGLRRNDDGARPRSVSQREPALSELQTASNGVKIRLVSSLAAAVSKADDDTKPRRRFVFLLAVSPLHHQHRASDRQWPHPSSGRPSRPASLPEAQPPRSVSTTQSSFSQFPLLTTRGDLGGLMTTPQPCSPCSILSSHSSRGPGGLRNCFWKLFMHSIGVAKPFWKIGL